MGAEAVRECVMGCYALAYLSEYGGSGAGYIDDRGLSGSIFDTASYNRQLFA